MRERFVLLFVVVAVFSLPATCSAEVMDKEFSLSAIWTASGTLTILGYLLGRYRIWAGIIAFVLAALMAWAQIEELIDPYVGPAIASEAGRSYFVQSYFASALALVAPIAGVIQRRIRDSRQFRCQDFPL